MKLAVVTMSAALLGGCASTSLRETVWVPAGMENQDEVKLEYEIPVWFSIDEDNRVTGFSGVNTFGGLAVVDEKNGVLRFEGLFSTLMAGPNLAYERKFHQTLNGARSFTLKGNSLALFDADGQPLATFTPGADELKRRR